MGFCCTRNLGRPSVLFTRCNGGRPDLFRSSHLVRISRLVLMAVGLGAAGFAVVTSVPAGAMCPAVRFSLFPRGLSAGWRWSASGSRFLVHELFELGKFDFHGCQFSAGSGGHDVCARRGGGLIGAVETSICCSRQAVDVRRLEKSIEIDQGPIGLWFEAPFLQLLLEQSGLGDDLVADADDGNFGHPGVTGLGKLPGCL